MIYLELYVTRLMIISSSSNLLVFQRILYFDTPLQMLLVDDFMHGPMLAV